jgi:hypothetical protein
MARGRMFDRAFMKSRKVQSLIRDHRLVYASIFPFLDREGRINAEPLVLKANVFRHSDFTIEELAAAVRAIAEVGLVKLYADEDNEAIIEYTRFHDFNTPNRKEAKSEFPGPDDSGSVPCRDPLITEARALPVQSTCNASGERNVNETSTSTRTGIQPSSAKPTRENHQPFLDAWNEHRGYLPACRTLDDKRRASIDALIKEHGTQALELFTLATRQVAGDDYWKEQGYGITNLLVRGRVLEKAEKYVADGGMDRGDRKLATTADLISKAIGGLHA